MTPREECEKLMNAILPFAIQMLERYGEFYPCGAKVTDTGEIVHVGVMDEKTDHPKSQPLIDALVTQFREEARAGTCRATAIVYDVKVVLPGKDMKTDAIQVNLDHRDGYSAEVFFPYNVGLSKKVDVFAPFAQKGKSEVFGITK